MAELAIAGCSFVMMILLKLRPYKPPSMQFRAQVDNHARYGIRIRVATLNSALPHARFACDDRQQPSHSLQWLQPSASGQSSDNSNNAGVLPIVIGAGLSCMAVQPGRASSGISAILASQQERDQNC